jgi:hypothetical protein
MALEGRRRFGLWELDDCPEAPRPVRGGVEGEPGVRRVEPARTSDVNPT